MSAELMNNNKKYVLEETNSSKNNSKQNMTLKIQNESINYIPFTKKWRVKLYILNENGQWDDKGIGHVFCANETEQQNNLSEGKQNSSKLVKKLIMLKEKTNEIIFNIDIINENIDFHNQRGTILTWKKGGTYGQDNNAISFQEKEGVLEILKNIQIINGKNVPEEELLKEDSSEMLLDVTIENLPNLVREYGPNMDDQKLSEFIEYLKETNCEFIKKLGKLLDAEELKVEEVKSCNSFSSLETNTSLNISKENNNNEKSLEINCSNDPCEKINKPHLNENINYIFNIFKNLILIGDKELLEILFDDECYLITFGAFEHDFQTNKIVPHRKYFKEIVKFKNPLKIRDTNLLQKINQTLRLTYFRDTAFSRLIDDNLNRTINNIVQMNHSDIIQFFINNKEYLEILFSQIKSEDINIQKEAILFLSELIYCSKNVVQNRITFNEVLCDTGILPILSDLIEENPKNNSNNSVKGIINNKVVEIFISILSSVPMIVKQFLRENEGHMLQQLANLLFYDSNFGLKYEVSQIFKTLIEGEGESYDKKIFFNSTIEQFVNFLISPNEGQNKNDFSSTIQIIIEIFMAWFNNMGFDSQYWLEKYQINLVLIQLFKEQNKIINLYAIKLLKIILENSEHYICIKILNNELCNLLINLFSKNIKKGNIISSCLMNLFDSISQNDIYILNIIMNYSSDFFYNNKEYFKNILLRYERKTTPKKKMVNYLNMNTITDTSLKELEPIFGSDTDNSSDQEIVENFNYLNYNNELKNDDEENDDDLFNKNNDIFSNDNNYDNKLEYLCKKRKTIKNIEDEENDEFFNYDEIEPLNKRLNNYGGTFSRKINSYINEKYKNKDYIGLCLKENDDELYNSLDEEDDDIF